jgi:lantibiotic modifying enzyme
VISGAAGSILGLLTLRGAGAGDCCLVAAERWGEELLAAASREGAVWSWAPSRTAGGELAGRPLTGLSHGAAGIAVALLELAAAGRGAAAAKTCLEAARGAFAYEDRLYDPERRDWPDLRRGGDPPRFAAAWCHGAPGIALARLRATVLDPARAAGHRRVAEAALATTVEELRRRSGDPDADASPCHGVLGLVGVLLDAASLLGTERYRRVAVDAAAELLDHHGRSGGWPSGVAGGGWNPSLMLGDAGVGWLLLRLRAVVAGGGADQPELSPGVALSTRKVTSSA